VKGAFSKPEHFRKKGDKNLSIYQKMISFEGQDTYDREEIDKT
jgi:hypothetical protein